MRQNNKSLRADIDLGGTFTDSISLDISRSAIHIQPSLATSKDPLLGDLEELIESIGIATSGRNDVARGTTIERKIEKIGRVTAKRFREMLESGNDPADANLPGFTPVQIEIRSSGGYIVVDTVEKAIECLTERWPNLKGEAFEAALQACIDGINHRVSPEDVRQAFVNAANEAGIRILL
jgi:N-methylhydantoinase A/oxoprolinase/acetone carboxylase beta subunit